METSATARLAVLLILFAFFCIIIYSNVAIFIRYILPQKGESKSAGRKVTKTKLAWHILFIVLVLAIYNAFVREPNAVKLYKIAIRTSKLPADVKLRIVQISDLHLEEYGIRESRAIAIIKKVKPDVILYTGDSRNIWSPQTSADLAVFIKELASIAPLYFVPGNWDTVEDEKILRHSGGIPMLGKKATLDIKGNKIDLLGLGWYRIRSLPGIARKLHNPRFQILIAHTCDGWETAASKGVDLYLCGHTHGGQVRLPVFGALLPELNLVGKYQAGLYKSGEKMLYINRGLGMEGGDIKIRFCCRPEVTLIELLGANAKHKK